MSDLARELSEAEVDDSLRAALGQVYASCPWVDIDAIIAWIRDAA